MISWALHASKDNRVLQLPEAFISQKVFDHFLYDEWK